MKGVLADINVQGHLELLLHTWESAVWHEVWESLQLTIYSFEELGLARDVADDVLWHACQQREVVLITANRNDEAPDSLEATIRDHNTADRLPVFTLADAPRMQHEPVYAKLTAEKLLDYLFRIDEIRGTGRLYVP